jgi:hypothetical protein
MAGTLKGGVGPTASLHRTKTAEHQQNVRVDELADAEARMAVELIAHREASLGDLLLHAESTSWAEGRSHHENNTLSYNPD